MIGTAIDWKPVCQTDRRDMEADRSVLLEAGFDELAGVSWSKGCYMGQELTARTKYRGLVKRRLVPVGRRRPLPAAGSVVLRDGVDVGTMRSGRDGIGLASLRLDAVGEALQRREPLRCGEATLDRRRCLDGCGFQHDRLTPRLRFVNPLRREPPPARLTPISAYAAGRSSSNDGNVVSTIIQ